jgi:hypothetical protein
MCGVLLKPFMTTVAPTVDEAGNLCVRAALLMLCREVWDILVTIPSDLKLIMDIRHIRYVTSL